MGTNFFAGVAPKVWHESVVNRRRRAGVPLRACGGIRTLCFDLIFCLWHAGLVLDILMLLQSISLEEDGGGERDEVETLICVGNFML